MMVTTRNGLYELARSLVLDWHDAGRLRWEDRRNNVVSAVFSHSQGVALAALVATQLADFRDGVVQTADRALADAEDFAERLVTLATA